MRIWVRLKEKIKNFYFHLYPFLMFYINTDFFPLVFSGKKNFEFLHSSNRNQRKKGTFLCEMFSFKEKKKKDIS